MRLQSSPEEFLAMAACVGLAGYVAVHSIPGTGALRSLMLLILVGATVVWSWRAKARWVWPKFDAVTLALATLTGWLFFQSGMLAVDGPSSLYVLTEEWVKNLFLAGVGILLARTATVVGKGAWIFWAITLSYFSHVVSTLVYQVVHYSAHGAFHPGYSTLGNYGYVSPFVDGALALAVADVAERFCYDRRLFPISAWGLAIVFAGLLLSLCALSAKASWVNVIFMVGAFVLVAFIKRPIYRTRLVGGALAIMTIVFLLITQTDNRWNGALRSIRYGQDIEAHTMWMGKGERIPDDIDESFYLRTAWGIAGLRGIAEHPLGRGYGTNAFGRYLDEKYGIKGAVSSHSGWLDFALANGLPGLVFLLTLGAALCAHSWRAFQQGRGIGGLTLALMTFAYLGRCLIDGHISTSKLMAFALVSGTLWALAWEPRSEHHPA